MSVDVQIDQERRLVRVTLTKTVTPEDMRAYLASTWARGGVEGFGELVDLRAVDAETLSFGDLLELSEQVLGVPPVSRAARLAMVAGSDEQASKAQFYGTARGSLRSHAQEFRTFTSIEEAEAWLTGS